jgi:hypothetical protein
MVFVFLCVSLAGQSRLGYTLESIKYEYPASKHQVLLEKTYSKTDTLSTYYVHFEDGVVAYFCNHNVCILTLIILSSEDVTRELIKKYNKDYIRVSKNIWRADFREDTNYIQLTYDEETKSYTFLWTFLELK